MVSGCQRGTTDNRSLWDSDIYTSAANEYRRSLNWRLSLIVQVHQSKFYMNNIQEPIARGYEIVFKTVLFSSKTSLLPPFQAMRAEENSLGFFFSRLVLFLDLFGLLFLIGKMVFVPLSRLIRQKISCCPTSQATKSIRSQQTGEVANMGADGGLSRIDRMNVFRRKNIEETMT